MRESPDSLNVWYNLYRLKRQPDRTGRSGMSASIVGDTHISGMIQAATADDTEYYWKDRSRKMRDQRQGLGQKLLNENYRSVNFYYGRNHAPPQFTFQQVDQLSPVQILKACDCYNYQACETNDYNNSEARAIVTAIQERAIHTLPGYESAEWELS